MTDCGMNSFQVQSVDRLPRRNQLNPAALLGLALLLGCCAAPQKPETRQAAREKIAPAPPIAASPVAQPSKPAPPPLPESDDWRSLFDGKTLKGWTATDFAGRGEARVADGKIILESGVMTG